MAREDGAYDAIKGNTGIGIKTFVAPGDHKTEKVAEFNKLSTTLRDMQGMTLVRTLANYRNARIEWANRTYGVQQGFYHCVARRENRLLLFSEAYEPIDIASLKLKTSKSGDTKRVSFEDEKHRYNYNPSKSTLFKTFHIPKNAVKIDIQILEDPYEMLLRFAQLQTPKAYQQDPFVILPLYSTRSAKGGEKHVPQHSGLNQWNASGRKRKSGEVYIPVPWDIHKRYQDFFPPPDTIFRLKVPTGEIYTAKMCQENSKALMTNPNDALSDWLLRGIFNLKDRELMTYDKLLKANTDSVRITKSERDLFTIDFADVDAYEEFMQGESKFTEVL